MRGDERERKREAARRREERELRGVWRLASGGRMQFGQSTTRSIIISTTPNVEYGRAPGALCYFFQELAIYYHRWAGPGRLIYLLLS